MIWKALLGIVLAGFLVKKNKNMYKLTLQNVIDFTEYWIEVHSDEDLIPKATEYDVMEYFNLLHENENSTAEAERNPT